MPGAPPKALNPERCLQPLREVQLGLRVVGEAEWSSLN